MRSEVTQMGSSTPVNPNDDPQGGGEQDQPQSQSNPVNPDPAASVGVNNPGNDPSEQDLRDSDPTDDNDDLEEDDE